MEKRVCGKCKSVYELRPEYFRVCKYEPLTFSKTCKNCLSRACSEGQNNFNARTHETRVKFVNARLSAMNGEI